MESVWRDNGTVSSVPWFRDRRSCTFFFLDARLLEALAKIFEYTPNVSQRSVVAGTLCMLHSQLTFWSKTLLSSHNDRCGALISDTDTSQMASLIP
jgi:hypothetical protein